MMSNEVNNKAGKSDANMAYAQRDSVRRNTDSIRPKAKSDVLDCLFCEYLRMHESSEGHILPTTTTTTKVFGLSSEINNREKQPCRFIRPVRRCKGAATPSHCVAGY